LSGFFTIPLNPKHAPWNLPVAKGCASSVKLIASIVGDNGADSLPKYTRELSCTKQVGDHSPMDVFGNRKDKSHAHCLLKGIYRTLKILVLSMPVILNWKTATEVNNSGFEIQRLVSGKDENWNKIGFINGNQSSNAPAEYSFTDNTCPAGYSLKYRLKQIDNNGNYKYSETLDINSIPAEFSLSQNYPNPFNPSTVIKYSVAASDLVTLKLFDLLGRNVRILVNQIQPAGVYEVQFNASDLPGGVYFYNLSSGNFHQTRKLMLLK